MKNSIIVIAVIVVIGVAVYLLFGNGLAGLMQNGTNQTAAENPTLNSTPTTIPPVKSSGEVNVEGRLVPNQSVSLSFNASGVVEEVLVAEGQMVKKGDLLAQMKNQAQIQASIASARLEVINAQKSLDDLFNNVQSTLTQINLDITQALKQLKEVKRTTEYLNSPRATQARIDEMNKDIKYAKEKVADLQEIYDHAEGKTSEIYDALKKAKLDRDQLINNLAWLLSPVSQDDLDEARAKLEMAQFKYDDLKRRAEIYQKGPDPADVKIAQARIDNARVQLTSAEEALKQRELRAPFDGTIIKLDIKSGEYVNLGTPVITLADISIWRIETTNLSELSVTQIKEGNPVLVHFDAMPEEEFEGKLIFISKLGETRQGEINYKVIIELNQTDPRFRWNMTAPVVIKAR